MTYKASGRPPTGRNKKTIYLTIEEEKAVRKFVDIVREKGADYAFDLLKRVQLLKYKEELESQ